MVYLVLGLILLIGVHLLPSAVRLRGRLIERLGDNTYRAVFSVLSLGGLVLIVVGMSHAPFQPLWEPPAWTRWIPLLLMPLATVLIAAAYLPSNIRRRIRHPMLTGVAIWSFAHLAANGDVATLLLFGSFGLYALFDMASANRRGARLAEAVVAVHMDIATVLVGVIAYIILLWAHPHLFGVAALT